MKSSLLKLIIISSILMVSFSSFARVVALREIQLVGQVIPATKDAPSSPASNATSKWIILDQNPPVKDCGSLGCVDRTNTTRKNDCFCYVSDK